jgi:Domain of unknown function (DUF4913)
MTPLSTDGVLRRPALADDSPSTDARVARLESLIDELTQRLDEAPHASSDADEGAKPLYTNVEDWVRGYLLVNFTRPFGEVGLQRWYWCEQWWRHNEAVTTLTALWYAWEHARLEPTGMIGWLHEMRYHLGVVGSADGPFRECAAADHDRPAKHRPDQFADAVPAPENWWNWWSDE